MNAVNYDRVMQEMLANATGKRLLLHSCCAPCSSYCLEEVAPKIETTVLYYNPNLDSEEEGGARCTRCFELRLSRTAGEAKVRGYDYFATTLTLSPLKDARRINEIGFRLQEEMGVLYLPTDFKKRGGYLRSVQLSREHNLYRQNYCGCIYSKNASR